MIYGGKASYRTDILPLLCTDNQGRTTISRPFLSFMHLTNCVSMSAIVASSAQMSTETIKQGLYIFTRSPIQFLPSSNTLPLFMSLLIQIWKLYFASEIVSMYRLTRNGRGEMWMTIIADVGLTFLQLILALGLLIRLDSSWSPASQPTCPDEPLILSRKPDAQFR